MAKGKDRKYKLEPLPKGDEWFALGLTASKGWFLGDPAITRSDLTQVALLGIVRRGFKNRALAVLNGRDEIVDYARLPARERRRAIQEWTCDTPQSRSMYDTWTPFHIAQRKELIDLILDCELLTLRQKQLLELYLEGWTVREIAMGIPLDRRSVQRHFTAAMAKLRAHFGIDEDACTPLLQSHRRCDKDLVRERFPKDLK